MPHVSECTGCQTTLRDRSSGARLLQVRTEAYQRALQANPSLMRGARVLDVGCGTGILSMFAARGGASHVAGAASHATGPGTGPSRAWVTGMQRGLSPMQMQA